MHDINTGGGGGGGYRLKCRSHVISQPELHIKYSVHGLPLYIPG